MTKHALQRLNERTGIKYPVFLESYKKAVATKRFLICKSLHGSSYEMIFPHNNRAIRIALAHDGAILTVLPYNRYDQIRLKRMKIL